MIMSSVCLSVCPFFCLWRWVLWQEDTSHRVPLGVGRWPLGWKERRCWANCPCNQFLRFPTYVILIHQRHRQTDRQTDGRHAIWIPRFALVHRAVKTQHSGHVWELVKAALHNWAILIDWSKRSAARGRFNIDPHQRPQARPTVA